MSSTVADTAKKRMRFVLLLSILLLVIIAGRLFWVQGINPAAAAKEAADTRNREEIIAPTRGSILDKNGNILAVSVDRYDLVVDQRDQKDTIRRKVRDGSNARERISWEQAIKELSVVLDQDVDELTKAIRPQEGAKPKGYVMIAKSVTPEVRNEVMEIGIPRLNSVLRSERQYPQGVIAGPLLGFVRNSEDQKGVVGAEGLELSQEEHLAGSAGKRKFEVSADGVRIPTTELEETPAVNGQDVMLSIDNDIQYVAQRAAEAKQKQFNAEWATVIVQEVKTGKLLAIGDSAELDPNNPGATEPEFRRSVSITRAFEPGSTGKAAIFAAAIDQGKVKPLDEFTVPNKKTFTKETINDSLPHATYDMTAAGIFARSYNTGTVMVGNTVSKQTRYDYMRAFGLGTPIDVGLNGASAGQLAAPETWDRRQQYTTMFGQGYSQTALHTASIFQTLANGGVRIQPSLIDGYRNEDGSISEPAERKETRVVKDSTASEMLKLMESVVESGTGTKMKIPGYRVGGKSGTGQAASAKGYDGYTYSFAGVAPLDDPQYVVVATMYRPQGNWRNFSVADTFTEVMSHTLNTYNVPPSTSDSEAYNVFVGEEQKKPW
ncbi:peptidoglycan D,D-transpeptidase FtsI family protein [Glutamicibacter protophormiae]|uniref:Cell division protein FtsI (Penicillin-binding protein 3) n=1 Tax=Glutamicibacter protophormiae TaxID=37930 RepID=A0ABS4XUC5_GLUPR|nr:penicillin-binding protein 2 [Glutamicibacter protophormiae]MBP2400112.1 cell division protein FtsI (penicillin-binding protein 3) [Glutamicibacter protophormiae]WPR63424.1 penicillin-binding protein 2 [Glutamicibacter protophormiae]WPR66920.1 penicillin-binding protein 2 [Glutamicibacter protophormiae]GGL75156.1 cell division protein FtsI [Glutamicibacter protophormiae]